MKSSSFCARQRIGQNDSPDCSTFNVKQLTDPSLPNLKLSMQRRNGVRGAHGGRQSYQTRHAESLGGDVTVTFSCGYLLVLSHHAFGLVSTAYEPRFPQAHNQSLITVATSLESLTEKATKCNRLPTAWVSA